MTKEQELILTVLRQIIGVLHYQHGTPHEYRKAMLQAYDQLYKHYNRHKAEVVSLPTKPKPDGDDGPGVA